MQARTRVSWNNRKTNAQAGAGKPVCDETTPPRRERPARPCQGQAGPPREHNNCESFGGVRRRVRVDQQQAHSGIRAGASPRGPRNTSHPEDRLEIDFLVGGIEPQAALDMVQVFEHQRLGARDIAVGDGLNDFRVLVS